MEVLVPPVQIPRVANRGINMWISTTCCNTTRVCKELTPAGCLLQILEACCGAAGCTPYKQWQTLANTTTLCMYPGNLCRCLRRSCSCGHSDVPLLCVYPKESLSTADRLLSSRDGRLQAGVLFSTTCGAQEVSMAAWVPSCV